MQQQAASASVTDSDTQRQQSENINLPGRNTCKGGFLLRTFGAIYNGDTRLHNSHYSNNIHIMLNTAVLILFLLTAASFSNSVCV